MRWLVFALISFMVVASSTVGFLVFFLHSPVGDEDGGGRTECTDNVYYRQVVEFFDRTNVLGVSLPALIGGALGAASFGPPMLYSCSRGEDYVNIDLYYFATLLHAVFTLTPLLFFAYSVTVLDKAAFGNVHGVLTARFGCSDSEQPMSLSEFDTVYSLCRVALYSLAAATVLGHSPLIMKDKAVHPADDDEQTSIEKRGKSVAVPLSMVCVALAVLLFAYLSYSAPPSLPDVCEKTTAPVVTMLFRYSLLCTFSCAAAFVLIGMSAGLRRTLRAGELAKDHQHRHERTLRTYTTVHVVFANIVLICSVSLLHSLFAYDWAAAAGLADETTYTAYGTHPSDQCVPEFTTLTKVLYCCATGAYLLAVVFPHLGWLTQKARPYKYSLLTTSTATSDNTFTTDTATDTQPLQSPPMIDSLSPSPTP